MNEQQRFLNEIRDVLNEFEGLGPQEEIRNRVLELSPAVTALRDLGKSLIPLGLTLSARERLLRYFQMYPLTVIHELELTVVAGISEWARRIRELRVQFGWKIISGMTAQEMVAESELGHDDLLNIGSMGPNDYVLLDAQQDKEAAYRWNLANDIRKRRNLSMKDRIIEYLRRNVGKEVTGEELRYVAKGSEWARRVRELRTEDGFPISTKQSGNPHLDIGVYVLEEDRQTPKHDRSIREPLRRQVLRRDEYICRKCGWSHMDWNKSDPRFLEVHHKTHHARGGETRADNLITYCNVCHDEIHRLER